MDTVIVSVLERETKTERRQTDRQTGRQSVCVMVVKILPLQEPGPRRGRSQDGGQRLRRHKGLLSLVHQSGSPLVHCVWEKKGPIVSTSDKNYDTLSTIQTKQDDILLVMKKAKVWNETEFSV